MRSIIEKLISYKKFISVSYGALIFLLISRLLANFIIPLNDTTEARYTEIARKMLETGNWVTLQQDYGIPFWAKPPLSTWLTAISMKCFGINEFAARLPSLILSLAMLWLVWKLAKKQVDSVVALITTLVLSGSFFFFLNAGAVMTEPALIFCTTLSFVAFWFAINEETKLWSYLFFVGLGLGLLAKGPIAVVLVGLPIFFWVLLRKEWLNLWRRLPWVTGTLLLCFIALPWYLLAEHRTPGFLNYFILGEHVQRFLTPGWSGDKYGMAHNAPKGIIWIFALVGLLPWTGILLFWLLKYRRRCFKSNKGDGWTSYLVLNTVLPLLFFTFAGNIIYPYVFPILPAFALLFTEIWKSRAYSLAKSFWIPYCAVIAGVFALVASILFTLTPNYVGKTQKPVIAAWQSHAATHKGDLVYWGPPDFSAQFYSHGLAKAGDLKYICALIQHKTQFYLFLYERDSAALPAALLKQLQLIEVFNFKKNKALLLYNPASSPLPSLQCQGF